MPRIAAMTFVLALVGATALADVLRSEKHLVKIDVQSASGASRQYNVQVFDGESRSHVAHLKVAAKGGSAGEAEAAVGDIRYTVRVIPYGEAYLLEFTATNSEGAIDTMRGGFNGPVKSTPERPQPARAGRDVNEPAVLRRVEPVYTEEAKAAGAAGSVVLEITIDKSGFVRDATVVKPMGYGLSESAVEAVKQWQFAPSHHGRNPVEVLQEVTIEFKP